ncbi:hypothetical protein [Nocardioides korecus]
MLLASAPSAPTLLGRPAAAGVNGGGGGTDNCVQPSGGNGNCAGTFDVTVGSVTGLVPTRSVSVPVTFSNPNSFDIVVDGYSVTVPRTNATGCPTTSVQAAGQVTLPSTNRVVVVAKKSASLSTVVTMLNSSPNACKGAQYTINVTASAVKK